MRMSPGIMLFLISTNRERAFATRMPPLWSHNFKCKNKNVNLEVRIKKLLEKWDAIINKSKKLAKYSV